MLETAFIFNLLHYNMYSNILLGKHIPLSHLIIAEISNTFWRYFYACHQIQDINVNTSRQEIIKMRRLVTQPYSCHGWHSKRIKRWIQAWDRFFGFSTTFKDFDVIAILRNLIFLKTYWDWYLPRITIN